MKSDNKKRKFDGSRFVKTLISVTVGALLLGGTVAFSEPGDSDDPVVTKSYIVSVVVPQLKAYVEQRLGNSEANAYSDEFVVVDILSGQTVSCEAGAELILRKGSATVIATDKGGLADTTAGYDLGNGSAMPANHLLIVPVDDGRGFRATSDAIVMIKGGYNISG